MEEAELEEVRVQESLLIRIYCIGDIAPSRKSADEEKIKEDHVSLSGVKQGDT